MTEYELDRIAHLPPIADERQKIAVLALFREVRAVRETLRGIVEATSTVEALRLLEEASLAVGAWGPRAPP